MWRRCSDLLLAAVLLLAACGAPGPGEREVPLTVPHGYVDRLEIIRDGHRYRFGPFVGYYFRPQKPTSLERLDFVVFNERRFYTLDQPANARLYEGSARLQYLPETGFQPPADGDRIQPVFFEDAPTAWLENRPQPHNEYLHFHSGYDAAGAARLGYWLRHVAVADFTYDMGGRVTSQSPLYHRARPGVDRHFARIVEFDRGPAAAGASAAAEAPAHPAESTRP